MATPSPGIPPTGAIRLLEVILLLVPVIGIMLQITLRTVREDSIIHRRDTVRGALIVYTSMYLLVGAAWLSIEFIKAQSNATELTNALDFIKWSIVLIMAFVTILAFNSVDTSKISILEVLLPVPLLQLLEKVPLLKNIISYQSESDPQTELDEDFHERKQ